MVPIQGSSSVEQPCENAAALDSLTFAADALAETNFYATGSGINLQVSTSAG